MHFSQPPLIMTNDSISDYRGTIHLSDLPDPAPRHQARLNGDSKLMERLWRIALDDVESNMHTEGEISFFGGGANFGRNLYTRDISYSGVLGLNRLFPQQMRQSLEHCISVRLNLGYRVPVKYHTPQMDAPWVLEACTESEFKKLYGTNNFLRRTDDVVWLWAASDLLGSDASREDWRWVYDTGKRCYNELYAPLFDRDDGLYRGQASFIDIHFENRKASGYPAEWSIADCILQKTTSTNALHVKGLEVMALASERCGFSAQAQEWQKKADALRTVMKRELRHRDGSFTYYKDRAGVVSERRQALGTALAVLFDVVTGDEARAAVDGYPVTDAGVPIFQPFFDDEFAYHNLTAWPFVDAFYLQALEKVDGVDHKPQTCALMARSCVKDGSFHEWCHLPSKEVRGSAHQLWTAAAFLGTCMRAGMTISGIEHT